MAKSTAKKAPVSDEILADCLTKAVAEGDIVNFRYVFTSNSPLRSASPEDIASDKYAYMRPGEDAPARDAEARALVRAPETWSHIKRQLEKKGPPQLPSPLLLELADNAIRLEKYNAAAQALELLRIRRRMQELYFDEGDAALDAGNIREAVRAYVIATGLEYDYAAFPEPMPAAPNYQSRALILHAVYPHRPEDALALQPAETHLRVAFEYLMMPEAAGRLDQRSLEQRLEFLRILVRLRDPEWDAFTARYHRACNLAEICAERIERSAAQDQSEALANEIAAQQEEHHPEDIPAELLGRKIEDGAWWQYVKELAYRHPPSVLFLVRQRVSRDAEILMPRYAKDSQLVRALGLERPAPATA